jgi:hypothetical protein
MFFAPTYKVHSLFCILTFVSFPTYVTACPISSNKQKERERAREKEEIKKEITAYGKTGQLFIISSGSRQKKAKLEANKKKKWPSGKCAMDQ